MLSYRHAFHAGNSADVLKHTVLIHLLAYLKQKEKPFWVIDTHAGAGAYALDSDKAAKLGEYRTGIGRVWDRNDLPAQLSDYVALVRGFNEKNQLRHYPGSPLIALAMLRGEDRLRAFERHSKDVQLLAKNGTAAEEKRWNESGKRGKFEPRFVAESTDGFAGLKALLPPQTRRALVLIDPSYEEKQDYDRVIFALKDALVRFPTGTYMLWYPQLTRLDAHELPKRLTHLPTKNWLQVSLQTITPSKDGFGMYGSGLFIINPPWTLHENLSAIMPYLVKVLGQDASAKFTLEHATT